LAENSQTKIFIITARFLFFGLRKLRNSKLRKEKKKITVKTQCSILFFGLLKQVNIIVEDKTKGAIFAPFSVSVILFSSWRKILKQKSLLSHKVSEKKNSVTCLELLGQTVVFYSLFLFL